MLIKLLMKYKTIGMLMQLAYQKIELLPAQKKFQSLIQDRGILIVFGVGPAGTGKTMISCYEAADMLKKNMFQKIIITRPAITVDEELGFLPGTLNEKMSPWVNPLFDYFNELEPKLAQKLLAGGNIEIVPLAFIRGRTFNNAFIIGDEMQNATPMQMKTLLTRIGRNSKLVITGDLKQSDIGIDNGLNDILNRIKTRYENPYEIYKNGIGISTFHLSEVKRNPVIKEILELYEEVN